MLKSAGQEPVHDPLVALEEEEIKKVEDELKKVKEKIDRFEAKHSEEELSQNASYIAEKSYRNLLVARVNGIEANRSEARRERLEAQARKNPAVAAAAIEVLATVCHWPSQNTRPIRVPDSFLELTVACAQLFPMEFFLHGAHFKLYTFPSNSSSVIGYSSERQRIAEDNYAEWLATWQANAHTPPCIYVWSERQHDNCPNVDDLRDDDADDVSYPSESLSELRRRMRHASGYRCLACDHNYETAADSLELCHLLTLEEVNDVDVDEQVALYDTCGLLQVHDVYNTILLCSTCREHFDQHRLGIQEVGDTYTFRWVVQTALRSTRLPHCSDKTYGTLHDTKIVFPFVVPLRMAIAHRYQRFVLRANDRKRKRFGRSVIPIRIRFKRFGTCG